ncbi:hypothetical protein ACWKWU_17975 [Chitinophaga lutea]
MVEIFKTNVCSPRNAEWLTDLIHRRFEKYRANFDLEDCDRILRVISPTGAIDAHAVIALMAEQGYQAAVLPDEQPAAFPRCAIAAAIRARTVARQTV